MGDYTTYLCLNWVSSVEGTTTTTLHLGTGEGRGWEQQKCFAKTEGFKMLHKNSLSYSEIDELLFLEQAEITKTQYNTQKWSRGCLSWSYQWSVWVWIILTMVISSNSRCHSIRGKGHRCWSQTAWVQILILPLTGFVTLTSLWLLLKWK